MNDNDKVKYSIEQLQQYQEIANKIFKVAVKENPQEKVTYTDMLGILAIYIEALCEMMHVSSKEFIIDLDSVINVLRKELL